MDENGPLKRLELRNTNRPMDVIMHWYRGGTLNLNPPYQRGDVWGAKRRRNLIRSVLLGIPIPSIVINDRFDAGWGVDEVYAVIDGKQRMTTVIEFCEGRLKIPGSWIGMSGDVTFNEMPVATQRGIKNHPLAFSEGTLATIEDEIEVFELVNYGGVPQGESD